MLNLLKLKSQTIQKIEDKNSQFDNICIFLEMLGKLSAKYSEWLNFKIKCVFFATLPI